MIEELKVKQIDRDAAAAAAHDLELGDWASGHGYFAERFVQAFAKHRLDAIAARSPDPLVERLREALKPFADALDEAGDNAEPDNANIWEAPLAMCITFGDFRKARSALSSIPTNVEAQ